MALTPLASTSSLPAQWRSDPRAEDALNIASAAIRDAAGCPISSTTATVRVDGSGERLLRLPGPISSIASVSLEGVALTEGDDFRWISEGLWRYAGWAPSERPGSPGTVMVTYTFGLATVPEDIVDLCAQLATAWLEHDAAGGGSLAGVSSVRLDDAQENYTDEAAGHVSPIFIPKVTRDWLAARFGGPSVTVIETI